jgi:two-component system, chemotaxis family, sensor kinase CheA
LSELQHQLEQINAALADLRASADDGPQTRKQLDSLFRRVHNLKAAASADGLNDLSNAAHELENVLHSLRTGTTTLDDTVVQQLTQSSAALSENLIPTEIWNSLKAEEKHSLRQSLNEGANIFLLQTSFNRSDFDRQFQSLKQRLSNEGEVISVAPSVQSERAEEINFRILYACGAEAGLIREDLAAIDGVMIQELLIQTLNSIDAVFQRAVRAGQALAIATGKKIEFEVRGQDVALDKSICDAIAAPVLHLVRNAVDHGIESRGKIVLETMSDDDRILIRITDDGRGIDPAILPMIFQPGFSTAREVSAVSGRGVGLDAVQAAIEELGGSVSVSSEPGRGSIFTLICPNPKPNPP